MEIGQNPTVVLEALGDKVVQGIAEAVRLAREDYALFREEHPRWASEATERGIASFVHDRLFAHLKVILDDVPGISIVDNEPTREIWVGYSYRIRVKRHDSLGATQSYPTQTALDFLEQPDATPLEGLAVVHLTAGYVWHKEAREIGAAVVSFRDGATVIWMEELPDTNLDGMSNVEPMPTVDDPTPPGITINIELPGESDGTGTT